MVNYTKVNKKWWNATAPIHFHSKLYNLKDFKKGKTSLQEIELKELGNVKGKTLLHLMCHFGLDTLSWARKGAVVTGVDMSDTSITLAKNLSSEIHTPAEFICSNIYTLPKVLHKKFDIVFTSYGVLLWLSNMKKWAEIINHFLKNGGVFYIVDLHPFTNILSYKYKMTYNYFDKGPFLDDSEGTYTNWKEKISGEVYEWGYTLGEVINALIDVGLTIEYVHEFPFTSYEQFPGLMKKNKKGQFVLKENLVQTPLLFSIRAHK